MAGIGPNATCNVAISKRGSRRIGQLVRGSIRIARGRAEIADQCVAPKKSDCSSDHRHPAGTFEPQGGPKYESATKHTRAPTTNTTTIALYFAKCLGMRFDKSRDGIVALTHIPGSSCNVKGFFSVEIFIELLRFHVASLSEGVAVGPLIWARSNSLS